MSVNRKPIEFIDDYLNRFRLLKARCFAQVSGHELVEMAAGGLDYEGEKNTRRRGWIVFAFSSFSPTEVTNQKQIEFNLWSDNQNLNAADKTERERERERER